MDRRPSYDEVLAENAALKVQVPELAARIEQLTAQVAALTARVAQLLKLLEEKNPCLAKQ